MRIKFLRNLGRTKADIKAGQREYLEGQTYDIDDKEARGYIERGLAVLATNQPHPFSDPSHKHGREEEQPPPELPKEPSKAPATFGDSPRQPAQQGPQHTEGGGTHTENVPAPRTGHVDVPPKPHEHGGRNKK